MSTAAHSKRYRERRRAQRDAMLQNATSGDASPAERVLAALDEIVSISEIVTPFELSDGMDPLAAEGIVDDCALVTAWLNALQVVARRRAKP